MHARVCVLRMCACKKRRERMRSVYRFVFHISIEVRRVFNTFTCNNFYL